MNDLNIADGDFDKLIEGKPGVSGWEANELARIMRYLTSTYVRPIPPATETSHLQAIKQANWDRAAAGSKTATAGAFLSVMEPLRAVGAGLRRFGFVHLSGSTAVWALVAALFLVSATGGLAAAGVLPDPIQSAVWHAANTVGIEVPVPAGANPGVHVSDPMAPDTINSSEGHVADQEAALASAQQAITVAEQAQKAAQEAAITSARCIEESMAQISTLVDGILGITGQAQAQAMVTEARNIGSRVKVCSDQAAAIGQSGVAYASRAAQLADGALEGNSSPSAQVLASVQNAQKAARMAETSAHRALAVSQSIVDNVSGLTASLVNSTVSLQQNLRLLPRRLSERRLRRPPEIPPTRRPGPTGEWTTPMRS